MSVKIIPPHYSPYILSILRIMVGLLFMAHGLGKVIGFPVESHFTGWEFTTLAGWSGQLELWGGLLIALGLMTRLVAFILSGEMAVAYFTAHAPQGFYPMQNGGELAVLYCFVFLYFAAAGGGAWSLDRIVCKDANA